MKNTEVNKLWKDEMASFFVEIGVSKADDSMMQLEEVFHLE